MPPLSFHWRLCATWQLLAPVQTSTSVPHAHSCHPPMPEDLPVTQRKTQKHTGLAKLWGASNWSPGRCSLSSAFGEPSSSQSCHQPAISCHHPQGIGHGALPESWARLEPASHCEGGGAGSSLSISFSPHSPS